MTPDRWAIERAVKASALPAPSRLIVLTLLTDVTNGTTVIPPDYAPSLSALVMQTGLGRSAVTDHLNRLEAGGWVIRHRPTTKEALTSNAHTSYTVTVPSDLVRETDGGSPGGGRGVVRDADQGGSPSGGLGDENSQVNGGGPGDGLGGVVREADGGSPSGGLNPMYSRTTEEEEPSRPKSSKKAPTTDTPPRADVEQLCERLLAWLAKKDYRQRPEKVTDEWRNAARLLLDRDGASLAEALDVLDWSQREPFWSQNIHGMPKFRKQYGQLEFKSRGARSGAASRPGQGHGAPGDPSRYTEEDYHDQRF